MILKMDSKIFINDYIKADIVFDILSQSIEKTRREIKENNSEEAKDFLKKLLEYEREVRNGNVSLMDKIIEGDV